MEQFKPDLTHNDWTPLPDHFIKGPYNTSYQMVNMQSNEMLPISYRVLMSQAKDDKKLITLDQFTETLRYASIVKDIMHHRGLPSP